MGELEMIAVHLSPKERKKKFREKERKKAATARV
jgi:hypothetical protein